MHKFEHSCRPVHRLLLLLFSLFCLFQTDAFARHLIGGDLTYKCLGGGDYEFTLTIFRDCASDGANFDPNIPIAIYRGADPVPFDLFDVPLDPSTIDNITSQNTNSCIKIPADVCVDRAIYTFTFTIPDYPSNESYHFVW